MHFEQFIRGYVNGLAIWAYSAHADRCWATPGVAVLKVLGPQPPHNVVSVIVGLSSQVFEISHSCRPRVRSSHKLYMQ